MPAYCGVFQKFAALDHAGEGGVIHIVIMLVGPFLGTGGRVVTETLTKSCGQRRTTSATTLDLPTPEGPETTVSRGRTTALGPGSRTVTVWSQ